MSRPVHYRPHGGTGLCDAWADEASAWSQEYQRQRAEDQAAGISRATPVLLPYPAMTTSLRKVTCPDCWREIKRMANDALTNAGRYSG